LETETPHLPLVPARFPRMWEVEGVEPLSIKARHLARNLYFAFAIAFKPSVLAIPAPTTSILDHPAREHLCNFNGEE